MDKNLEQALQEKGLELDKVQYFMLKEKLENLKREINEVYIKFNSGNDAENAVSYEFPIDKYDDTKFNYIKELAQVDYRINNKYNLNPSNITNLGIYNKAGELLDTYQFYHSDEFVNEFKSEMIKK